MKSQKKKRRSPRDTIRTVKALCARIIAEFHIPCDRQKIKNWETRHNPPFPVPDENGSRDWEACRKWIEALQKRKGESQSELELLDRRAEEAKAQNKILEVEERQFDFDQKRKKYIERDVARRAIVGALRTYHFLAKRILAANLSEEITKKIVTEIESEAKRIQKGEGDWIE